MSMSGCHARVRIPGTCIVICMKPFENHNSLRHRCYNVTQCAGCVSANACPHQLCWVLWECGHYIYNCYQVHVIQMSGPVNILSCDVRLRELTVVHVSAEVVLPFTHNSATVQLHCFWCNCSLRGDAITSLIRCNAI